MFLANTMYIDLVRSFLYTRAYADGMYIWGEWGCFHPGNGLGLSVISETQVTSDDVDCVEEGPSLDTELERRCKSGCDHIFRLCAWPRAVPGRMKFRESFVIRIFSWPGAWVLCRPVILYQVLPTVKRC